MTAAPSRPSKVPAIVVGVVGVIASWSLLPFRGPERAEHQAVANDAVDGQAAPEARAGSTRREIPLQARAHASDEHAAPASPAARPATDDTSEPPTFDTFDADFEQAARTEPANRRWESELSAQLATALAKPELAGAQLDELRCHTSVCRAAFSLTTAEHQDELPHALSEALPRGYDQHGRHASSNPDELRTIVYLTRHEVRVLTAEDARAAK